MNFKIFFVRESCLHTYYLIIQLAVVWSSLSLFTVDSNWTSIMTLSIFSPVSTPLGPGFVLLELACSVSVAAAVAYSSFSCFLLWTRCCREDLIDVGLEDHGSSILLSITKMTCTQTLELLLICLSHCSFKRWSVGNRKKRQPSRSDWWLQSGTKHWTITRMLEVGHFEKIVQLTFVVLITDLH